MRRLCAAVLLAALALVLAMPSAHAGQDRLAGHWKVTFWDQGDLLTFWVLGVEAKDGKLTGKLDVVPDAPQATVDAFTAKGDQLQFVLKFREQPLAFDFKVPKGELKKVRGTMTFNNRVYPVMLEATKAGSAKDLKAAVEMPEPKGTFKELKEEIVKQKDELTVFEIAEYLVKEAAADKAPLTHLKEALAPALKAAEEHGDSWATEVRFQLAGKLAGRELYAAYAEELIRLALESDAATRSAELQLRGLGILADSLQKQGKKGEAAKVQERITALEEKGHEENEKAGLGFMPAKYEGRKGNSVVLVELFTGAHCPPCVAADLAFEGLGKTYKTSEVVLLQYHLHIPRPDPLTSEDTVARQKYYGEGIPGTPTLVFNGKAGNLPGGGKAEAQDRYQKYREVIDPLLKEQTNIKLDVSAQRTGDAIAITAAAQGYKPREKLRLRLALVESWVRYPGSNGLSYHAHVVRALPGGADGFSLAKDGVKETAQVKLGDLREAVSKYLEGFDVLEGQRPLHYRQLRVVAFVQDDETQEVLHAVEVPVK